MSSEARRDTATTIGTWLLSTTGAVCLALAAPFGTALVAVLSPHLSTTLLLQVVGAQVLLLLAFLFVAQRAFARRGTLVAEERKKVAALEEQVRKLKVVEPYKTKWGCLTFEGDERLYCARCYFDDHRKIPTTRDGISFRFCAVCKTRVPSA